MSDTVCERIIHASFENGQTKAQISKAFGYAWSIIQSIIHKFEETGDMYASKKGGMMLPKLDKEHLNFMINLINSNTSLTLSEMKERLLAAFLYLVTISEKTLSRSLNEKCHIHLKKLTIEHDRHNNSLTKSLCQTWIASLSGFDKSFSEAVFLDEAAFNQHIK
ncbi:hypothetical protein IE53DRAFT_319656 [Violaceomyces palustris]|uniref:Uncharacterized protein n=1 Tax=Violaceomyces palustris TaxID=1673888 RepID=A0ACD0NR69_9BASI|nr:hypothetical protein IE53DRAFT_319656 [Violaceomyces palustris]